MHSARLAVLANPACPGAHGLGGTAPVLMALVALARCLWGQRDQGSTGQGLRLPSGWVLAIHLWWKMPAVPCSQAPPDTQGQHPEPFLPLQQGNCPGAAGELSGTAKTNQGWQSPAWVFLSPFPFPDKLHGSASRCFCTVREESLGEAPGQAQFTWSSWPRVVSPAFLPPLGAVKHQEGSCCPQQGWEGCRDTCLPAGHGSSRFYKLVGESSCCQLMLLPPSWGAARWGGNSLLDSALIFPGQHRSFRLTGCCMQSQPESCSAFQQSTVFSLHQKSHLHRGTSALKYPL